MVLHGGDLGWHVAAMSGRGVGDNREDLAAAGLYNRLYNL